MISFKHFYRRALASLAGISTLATMAVAPVAAQAAPAKPFADLTITKVADGTGHGSNSATFINTQNGFAPGDDTPTDGVVSSNDTVTYEQKISFSAAKERKIKVKYAFSGDYLESVATTMCVSGNLVKAEPWDQSTSTCTYNVPEGATEVLTQSVMFLAKDTGGQTVEDQGFAAQVSRDDGAMSYQVVADPVTVVSAPRVDLVLGNPNKPDKDNMTLTQRQGTIVDGSVTVKATQLTYPGFSGTKGISTDVPWTAVLDVSAFPVGTTWKILSGGTIDESSGSELTLSGKGDVKLAFTLPAIDWEGANPGATRVYDMHLTNITVAPGSESHNNGDGTQPGDGIGKNDSTEDDVTGAQKGWAYPNNDWARVVTTNPPEYSGNIYLKWLVRPQTYNKSMFDPANKFFNRADGTTTVWNSNNADSTDNMASGTQIRAAVGIISNNIDTGKYVIGDTWDSGEQRYDASQGLIRVMKGETEQCWVTEAGTYVCSVGGDALSGVDVGGYKMQWSRDRKSGKDLLNPNSENWIDGQPDATAQSVRVIFDDVPHGSDPEAGFYKMVIPMRVQSNNTDDSDGCKETVCDVGYAGAPSPNYGDVGGYQQYVRLVTPGPRSWDIKNELALYDQNGTKRENPEGAVVGQIGDTAEYTVTPTAKWVTDSEEKLNPKVSITLDKGVYKPVNTASSDWDMVEGKDEAGNITLTFTLKGGARAFEGYAFDGSLDLPKITYTTTVLNKASATTVDNSAGVTDYDDDTIASQRENVDFQVPAVTSQAGMIKADFPQTEIQDDLTWTFNIYGGGRSQAGAYTDTVIKMPYSDERGGDDCAMVSQMTGGSEYDKGCSAFSYSKVKGGVPEFGGIELDTENSSSDVKFQYAEQIKDSVNPAEYTWVDDPAELQTGHVYAIRVIAKFENMLSSAVGTITLHQDKVNSYEGQKFNMWIGGTAVKDSGKDVTSAIPWPGVINVVSSTVTGKVWWDADNDTHITAGEQGIDGVFVSLYKADASGNKFGSPVLDHYTNAQGEYRFDELHSGRYLVEISKSKIDGTVVIPEQIKSYYQKSIDVSGTRSWQDKLYENAKTKSDAFDLPADYDQKNIDFGFHTPDPKVTLDKQNKGVVCPEDETQPCTVTWDVTITNTGNTTIGANTATFTDRTSDNVNITDTQTRWGIPFKSVSTGDYHSLAVSESGDLYAWGSNSKGQLGDGDTDPVNHNPQTSPKLIDMDGVRLESVSAGYDHSLAVSESGDLYAWGNNDQGQLGDDTTTPHFKPTLIDADGVRFRSVSAGLAYSLAVSESGDLYTWGYNGNGQLGDGTMDNHLAPLKIKTSERFKLVSAGWSHSLALTESGDLYAWGANGNGQLGDGTKERRLAPVKVNTSERFKSVSAGYIYSLAVSESGIVYAWGINGNGQLGDGTKDSRLVPVKASTSVYFESVSAGSSHSLALTESGVVYAWGSNEHGQLGNDEYQQTSIPVQADTGGVRFGSVSAGRDYSLGLSKSGDLYSWGYNNYGQLGDGTRAPRFSPVEVTPSTYGYVQQKSEQAADGYVTRTYAVPIKLEPGDSTTYRITGTVMRTQGKKTWAVNQAWFDAPDMPRSGTPTGGTDTGIDAKGNPAAPSQVGDLNESGIDTTSGGSKYVDSGTYDVVGNASCNVGATFPDASATSLGMGLNPAQESPFALPEGANSNESALWGLAKVNGYGSLAGNMKSAAAGDEHTFGDRNPAVTGDYQGAMREDSCDQVAVPIKASSVVIPQLGSISGVVWFDRNDDGLQGTEPDTDPVAGAEVYLLNSSGEQIGKTLTGSDGKYKFSNLPLAKYSVQFSKPELAGKATAFTATQVNHKDDADTSDANDGTHSPGLSPGRSVDAYTLTASDRDKTGVDAGIIVHGPSIEVEKFIDLNNNDGDGEAKSEEYLRENNVSVGLDDAGVPAAQTVTFVITNTGDEPLADISLSDATVSGSKVMSITCGQSLEGITLEPTSKISCTGTLQMNAGEYHEDTATVKATSAKTHAEVTASDGMRAHADVSLDIAKLTYADATGSQHRIPKATYEVTQCTTEQCGSLTGESQSITTGDDSVQAVLAKLALPRYANGEGEDADSDGISNQAGKSTGAATYWKITETKAPAGYLPSAGWWVLSVRGDPMQDAQNGSNPFTATIDPIDGAELANVKLTGDLTAATPSGYKVTVETTDPDEVTIVKTDAYGTALAGAVFDLCVTDDWKTSTNSCIKGLTTDASGVLPIEQLPGANGDYTSARHRAYMITETTAPEGFTKLHGGIVLYWSSSKDNGSDGFGNPNPKGGWALQVLDTRDHVGSMAVADKPSVPTIVNAKPIAALPLTGGPARFVLIGLSVLAMLALAGVVWRRYDKRRISFGGGSR